MVTAKPDGASRCYPHGLNEVPYEAKALVHGLRMPGLASCGSLGPPRPLADGAHTALLMAISRALASSIDATATPRSRAR
jgi:hypothetical protein